MEQQKRRKQNIIRRDINSLATIIQKNKERGSEKLYFHTHTQTSCYGDINFFKRTFDIVTMKQHCVQEEMIFKKCALTDRHLQTKEWSVRRYDISS